jgi:hypothetical protein
MSLLISGDLRLAKGWDLPDDADAVAYIAAVEAADEIASPGIGALEPATRMAINSFVKGCKADGIWPAIKASCILAGARTLAGALIPLVGTAPTNVGGLFVDGDYNRKTGLKGGTGPKYLRVTGVHVSSNPNRHGYIRCTEATSAGGNYSALMGGDGSNGGEILRNGSSTSFLIRPWGGSSARSLTNGLGGLGIARATSTEGVQFTTTAGLNTVSTAYVTAGTGVTIFARNASGGENTDPRIAFFSAGQFLNLTLLDARVTTLINAFAAAIP